MAHETYAARLLKGSAKLRAAVDKSEGYPHLRKKLRTATIDGETLYLAEGDLLLDEDQLRLYALEWDRAREDREMGLPPAQHPQGLVGITEDGKLVRWAEDKMPLTYAVMKQTFPDGEQYALAVENMAAATSAWAAACGVRFSHRADLDNAAGTSAPDALFSVRWIDASGQFIAAAFFPNDPAFRHRVLIDPSYFDPALSYDRVGVLRHELGHVLGFRHEHIRSGAPAVCPDEPLADTLDLTPFDPKSVMHYFCGGAGSRTLEITDLDRAGAQIVYGPPSS